MNQRKGAVAILMCHFRSIPGIAFEALLCVAFQGEEGDQGELGEVGAQGPPVKYFSVLRCMIPVVTGGYHYFCSLGEDMQKYFCKIHSFFTFYIKYSICQGTYRFVKSMLFGIFMQKLSLRDNTCHSHVSAIDSNISAILYDLCSELGSEPQSVREPL